MICLFLWNKVYFWFLIFKDMKKLSLPRQMSVPLQITILLFPGIVTHWNTWRNECLLLNNWAGKGPSSFSSIWRTLLWKWNVLSECVIRNSCVVVTGVCVYCAGECVWPPAPPLLPLLSSSHPPRHTGQQGWSILREPLYFHRFSFLTFRIELYEEKGSLSSFMERRRN